MRNFLAWLAALLLVLLAISLPACSTIKNASTAIGVIQGVRITQNQLDVMKTGYDGVLTAYNLYRYEDAAFTVPRRFCTKSGPFTIERPCAQYTVLAKIQPVLRTADQQFRKLQSDVTSCNELGDQSACSGLQGTVAGFNSSVAVAKAVLAAAGVGV